MRNADQFHIRKHHAWALFTIVHQHFDTLRTQLAVEFFRQLLHTVGLMHVHRQDRHLERSDVVRPDNATLVVVLLNSGSNHTRHPNTVAAHGQDLVTAIFTLNGGVQCAGVFITQLEDMPDFDTAFDHQGAVAVRAWIACHHVTNIRHFWRRDVAIPVNAEIVFAVDVRASREVAHRGDRAVNHNRNRHIHRTQGTRAGVDDGADFRFRCEG